MKTPSEQALELCWAIEKFLPASEQVTEIGVAACALRDRVVNLENAAAMLYGATAHSPGESLNSTRALLACELGIKSP